MLDNLKFAQYVNEERKKLIKSTRERGVYVSDNAQLGEVVARNSEIMPYEATSTDKISVTFLDADGTLLKREYLDIGGTVPSHAIAYHNHSLKLPSKNDLSDGLIVFFRRSTLRTDC